MTRRCHRCGGALYSDGGEPACWRCGLLPLPEPTACELRAEAEAELAAARVGKLRRRDVQLHVKPLGVDEAVMVELEERYGSLPAEAWDRAMTGTRRAHEEQELRARFARIAAQVDAGLFVAAPLDVELADDPDPEPRDPARWLAWRVRRGLPISAELLERELGLSSAEADRALAADWTRYLEGPTG